MCLARLGRVLRPIRHAAPWQHQKFKYRRYQVARSPAVCQERLLHSISMGRDSKPITLIIPIGMK